MLSGNCVKSYVHDHVRVRGPFHSKSVPISKSVPDLVKVCLLQHRGPGGVGEVPRFVPRRLGVAHHVPPGVVGQEVVAPVVLPVEVAGVGQASLREPHLLPGLGRPLLAHHLPRRHEPLEVGPVALRLGVEVQRVVRQRGGALGEPRVAHASLFPVAFVPEVQDGGGFAFRGGEGAEVTRAVRGPTLLGGEERPSAPGDWRPLLEAGGRVHGAGVDQGAEVGHCGGCCCCCCLCCC